MKNLILSILTLLFKKHSTESFTIRNKEIISSKSQMAISSYRRAEQQRKFEDAFEHYQKAADFLSDYHLGLYPHFSKNNLEEFVRQYSEEAIRWLPDDFVEEIEQIKLQIQVK